MTGASGSVGGYLAPAIAETFPQADLLSMGARDVVLPGWRNVIADVSDGPAVEAVVREFRPDLVLHLAAQSSVGVADGRVESTWRTNFCGTLELASACARHAPHGAFFFASTAEVYGRSFRDGPVSEATPLAPANPYARSKAAAEVMLADLLPPSMRLLIVRSFNHSGAGQDRRFVLPAFAAQIAEIEAGLKPPRLEVGNISAERDFLHVRDVCTAYVGLLSKPGVEGERDIYNVASGSCRKISDLVEALVTHANRPVDVVVNPALLRPNDIPRAVGDASRLADATGWHPDTNVEALLTELLEFWRAKIGNST